MTAQLRERTRVDPVFCGFCRTTVAAHVIEGQSLVVALCSPCRDRLRSDLTEDQRLFGPRRFGWQDGAPMELGR